MLLSVQSAQGVPVPALPAETRLLSVVVFRQAESGLLGMLRKISLAQLIHMFPAFVMLPELAPQVQSEESRSPAPLHKAACQLAVVFLAGHAVQAQERDLDLFVAGGLVIGGIQEVPHQQV